MELTDIASKDAWARLEMELFDRFRMNCTVYNTSGVGITGRPRFCNRLCPEIKANPDSLAAICAAGNQNFMLQAERTGRPVISECDAGLVKIAVPIILDGQFLGTAGGCGRLPEGGEVETFIIEKTTGMAEGDVAALCRGLETISPDQAQEMADTVAARLADVLDTARRDSARAAVPSR